MEAPFPAYEGDEPYVFVCYSHEDSGSVFSDFSWLRQAGLNVYYDEGISPGHEWTQELANAIDGCRYFLYFVSPASVASRHCRNEVQYALEKAKPLIPVHLEPTELPGGLRLSLGSAQAILKHDLSDERYRTKLLKSFGLDAEPVHQKTDVQWNWARRPWITAAAIAIALLAVATWWTYRLLGTTAEDRLQFDSIAVLPFSDVSAERDLDQLADLTTRKLINRLDELPTLRVASLAAIEPLLNQGLSLAEVGRRLKTPLMLVGYLQQFGDELEAPVELVRAKDGRVLWSETLNRVATDPQLNAQFVAGELSRFLGRISTLQDPGPTSEEAYRAWLNWLFHQANYRNWEEIKWIEEVILLEPQYARAHLDAYLSYYSAAMDGQNPVYIDQARASLEAASEAGLDNESRFLGSKGTYLIYLVGNLNDGEPLLRQSGLPYYATLLADSGLPEPAIKVFESATSRNPAFTGGWLGLGFARGMNGDLNGALSAFEEGLKHFPDDPYLLLNRNKALIFLGQYDEAKRSLQRLEALEPLPAGSQLAVRGNRYWLEGKQGNVQAAIRGAELLADEGWHTVAGSLFLEFGDQRVWNEFRLAQEHVVPGRRLVSSWLYLNPSWVEHRAVRSYLNFLGFTPAWRNEICRRSVPYLSRFNIQISCKNKENSPVPAENATIVRS